MPYLPGVAHTGHGVAGAAAGWDQLASTLTAVQWILVLIHTTVEGSQASEPTPDFWGCAMVLGHSSKS